MIVIRRRFTGELLLRLESQTLVGAMLAGAQLREAELPQADLRGADLTGADLVAADLTSADLSWAKLVNADLRDADLSHANLRGADLTAARYSSSTHWPPGLDPDSRGAYADGVPKPKPQPVSVSAAPQPAAPVAEASPPNGRAGSQEPPPAPSRAPRPAPPVTVPAPAAPVAAEPGAPDERPPFGYERRPVRPFMRRPEGDCPEPRPTLTAAMQPPSPAGASPTTPPRPVATPTPEATAATTAGSAPAAAVSPPPAVAASTPEAPLQSAGDPAAESATPRTGRPASLPPAEPPRGAPRGEEAATEWDRPAESADRNGATATAPGRGRDLPPLTFMQPPLDDRERYLLCLVYDPMRRLERQVRLWQAVSALAFVAALAASGLAAYLSRTDTHRLAAPLEITGKDGRKLFSIAELKGSRGQPAGAAFRVYDSRGLIRVGLFAHDLEGGLILYGRNGLPIASLKEQENGGTFALSTPGRQLGAVLRADREHGGSIQINDPTGAVQFQQPGAETGTEAPAAAPDATAAPESASPSVVPGALRRPSVTGAKAPSPPGRAQPRLGAVSAAKPEPDQEPSPKPAELTRSPTHEGSPPIE